MHSVITLNRIGCYFFRQACLSESWPHHINEKPITFHPTIWRQEAQQLIEASAQVRDALKAAKQAC
ncbi:hypothetical protein [Neisseria sp. 83E34]|uniref:hypothetical protein n=1 Tax=Neisseria sp. 83E34 TaxID=1692264 RepID=UPI000AD5BEE6|nr:hypothetical protein [Neisseria sp. 83E34]